MKDDQFIMHTYTGKLDKQKNPILASINIHDESVPEKTLEALYSKVKNATVSEIDGHSLPYAQMTIMNELASRSRALNKRREAVSIARVTDAMNKAEQLKPVLDKLYQLQTKD